jgi:hypothetical protein
LKLLLRRRRPSPQPGPAEIASPSHLLLRLELTVDSPSPAPRARRDSPVVRLSPPASTPARGRILRLERWRRRLFEADGERKQDGTGAMETAAGHGLARPPGRPICLQRQTEQHLSVPG